FPHIRYSDVMGGRVDPEVLKDKIVIVGSDTLASHKVLTPVGFLSRAELLATTVDNIEGERWIRHLGGTIYTIYLFVVMLITVWIILTYPQSVATIFLLALAIGLSALSVWIFDAFYLWVPVAAVLTEIAVTFIVFLSFQLSVNERRAWKL